MMLKSSPPVNHPSRVSSSRFRRSFPRFFFAAYCKFTRDSTSWEVAEETIHILDSAVKALLHITGATITKRKTVVVLHIQPKTLPFFQLLAPLVPAPLAALEAGEPKTMAVVIKWDKRKMTLDGPASLQTEYFSDLNANSKAPRHTKTWRSVSRPTKKKYSICWEYRKKYERRARQADLG